MEQQALLLRTDFYSDVEMMRKAIAQQFMFNVIDPTSGLKIDFWILKRDAYDARGVWSVQKESLDTNYLRVWATKLAVQTWLEKLEHS